MRGGDIGQGFLQDVVGAGFGKQAVNVEGAQGFHAAHAGSLGGGNAGGVDGAHEFGGAESAGQERLDGADDVPQGNAVEVVHHVCGDAVDAGVKSFGDLSTDEAAHRHAPGHADGGARVAGDYPFAGFFAVGGAGVVGFGVDEGAGCFLVADGEAQVTVQVDGGEFGGKVADHAEIVMVAAHTDAA